MVMMFIVHGGPDDEHGDHNSDNGDDVYFTCWF